MVEEEEKRKDMLSHNETQLNKATVEKQCFCLCFARKTKNESEMERYYQQTFYEFQRKRIFHVQLFKKFFE